MEHRAHNGFQGADTFHPDRACGRVRRQHIRGVKDLVFSFGIDDVLSAVDANTGKLVWQKNFPNPLKPLRPALHQLLQHRAGDTRNRQGAWRDLLHRQRRQVARSPSHRRQRGDDAHRHGAALQPQLEPQCWRTMRLHHRGPRLRWRRPPSRWNMAPWRRWMSPIRADPALVPVSIPARAVPLAPGAPPASPGVRRAPTSPPQMVRTIRAAASTAMCLRCVRTPGV